MPRSIRIGFAALAGALLAFSVSGGCSKSRADDFSKFKPSATVQEVGTGPRARLHFRPPAGEDVVYRLRVDRRTGRPGQNAKMRLRTALRVETTTRGSSPFVWRLISVQRMDPPPPGGLGDLGPALVLLRGRLGPQGRLSELQDTERMPSPVNLALALPLLLPRLPTGGVGVGARWRTADKLQWTRTRQADPHTHQPGYKGRADVLLKAAYHLTRTDAQKRQVVEAQLSFKLRSHTSTLSHTIAARGQGTARGQYVLDPAGGLPLKAQVTLQGRYRLRADDQKREAQETLELSLTRE